MGSIYVPQLVIKTLIVSLIVSKSRGDLPDNIPIGTATASPLPSVSAVHYPDTSSSTSSTNAVVTLSITKPVTTSSGSQSSFPVPSSISTTLLANPVSVSSSVPTSTRRPEITVGYIGYIQLENKVGDNSPITKIDVTDWLKKRTNATFELSNLKQKPIKTVKTKRRRRRRQTDEDIHLKYEVTTKDVNFSKNFERNENVSSSIKNHTVKKAVLLQNDTSNCTDNFNCPNGVCRVDDTGNFYCDPPSDAKNPPNQNLLALIAIPCAAVLIAVIAVIIYFVCKKRKEKKQHDITKIHPAIYDTAEDSTREEHIDARYVDGFSSVKSSNFEYNYDAVDNKLTGLY